MCCGVFSSAFGLYCMLWVFAGVLVFCGTSGGFGWLALLCECGFVIYLGVSGVLRGLRFGVFWILLCCL